ILGRLILLPYFLPSLQNFSSEMSNLVYRYRELRYEEALAKVHRYPIACKELSSILRVAYPKLPKNLHSVFFNDILTAFRLLPEMQTQSAVSAAHLLCQSAEAALPKQKKTLAVSEFRRAKVSHKRRGKTVSNEESTLISATAELPEEILALIFGFLDTQSLASVGNVCRSWHVAVKNNLIWQAHYAKIFGSDSDTKGRKTTSSTLIVPEIMNSGSSVDWKEAFKTAYIANSSEILASKRGYCHNCKTVVWLDSMKCCNEANCSTQSQSKNSEITHITSHQVVDYLLHGSSSLLSPSWDSDSDSDERYMWAAFDFSSY
ncbi:F-box protein At5g52880, partial [Linum perenne]